MMMTKPLRTECCAMARHRVAMRDSRGPMITDGTGDPFGLHRPGWRIPSGSSESDVALRDSQRKLVEEAHADFRGGRSPMNSTWSPTALIEGAPGGNNYEHLL
jgi:hypothetical protein